MLYFGIGLALGLLGVILWLIASVIGGIVGGTEEALGTSESGQQLVTLMRGLMSLGFSVMILGPLTFWAGVPSAKGIAWAIRGGKQQPNTEQTKPRWWKRGVLGCLGCAGLLMVAFVGVTVLVVAVSTR